MKKTKILLINHYLAANRGYKRFRPEKKILGQDLNCQNEKTGTRPSGYTLLQDIDQSVRATIFLMT